MRRGLAYKTTRRVKPILAKPALWTLHKLRSLALRIYAFRLVRRILHSRPARFIGRLALGLIAFASFRVLPWSRRSKQRIRAFAASKELLGWFIAILLCGLIGVFLGFSNYEYAYWIYFILTVAVIGGGAFTVLALKSPLFGVLFWISASPLLNVYAKFKFGPGIPALTGDRLCLLILAFALVLWAKKPSKAERLPAIPVLILLFVIAMLPAVIRAPEMKTGAQVLVDSYLAPMALFFFARRWVQDRSTLHKSLIAILVVGTYFAVLGVPEYFTARNFFTWSGKPAWVEEGLGVARIQGPSRSPAEYGLTVALASYVAVILAVWEKNRAKRMLYLLMLVLFSVVIYMTLRRGVYMGWILGMLALAVASARSRRVILPGLLVGVILSGIFVDKIVSSEVFTERIAYKAPVYQRLVLNATSIEIIKDRPWLGLGIGKFPEAIGSYVTSYRGISALYARGLPSPHNSYFRILTEAGLVGFLPFAMLIMALGFYTYRAYRRTPADGPTGRDTIALFWAFGFAHLMQAGSTDAFLYCPYLNAMVFFLAGAINGTFIQKENEADPDVGKEARRIGKLRSARAPVT